MRILITGASGLLGRQAVKKISKFHKVIGTYNSSPEKNLIFLDITQDKSVEELFQKTNPEAVIHAASIINIELCEENKELADQVNHLGAEKIVKACKKFNSKLCYISTDYVFDGKNNSYDENSKTRPINFYGKTKLFGEEIVKKILYDSIIIRPTVLYGIDEKGNKSFVQKTVKKLFYGDEVYADNSLVKYPLMTDDLIEAIFFLLNKKKSGIYHVSGQEATTYFDWALKIAKEYSLSEKLIHAVASHGKVQRPLNVKLNDEKIKQLGFKYKFNTIAEGIKHIKDFINAQNI